MIVHYGEFIRDLDIAMEASKSSDVVLIIGTSCAVLRHYKFLFQEKKVVICNLQWTSLDRTAHIKLNCSADVFVEGLLRQDELKIDDGE